MIKVGFYSPGEIADEKIAYVVTTARYAGKWLFCRHKARTTWDIPGGHREPGETPDEAARRELWEETGAEEAEISPVCIYSVENKGVTTYGMLYFAQVNQLGNLPDEYEMAQVMLSDKIPENLTHPHIQPELFVYIQGWLNTRSNAGELWDVYDESRKRTGRSHRRGDPLKPGEYHLVVHVWILNSKGEFLLTRRAPNKGFPNLWESTGGSALMGDDSLTAALREVKEETGLTLDPGRGMIVLQMRKSDYFRDVWLFRQDFHMKDVRLQPGETTDAMYADKRTIQEMWNRGDFVPYDYLQALFEAAGV